MKPETPGPFFQPTNEGERSLEPIASKFYTMPRLAKQGLLKRRHHCTTLSQSPWARANAAKRTPGGPLSINANGRTALPGPAETETRRRALHRPGHKTRPSVHTPRQETRPQLTQDWLQQNTDINSAPTQKYEPRPTQHELDSAPHNASSTRDEMLLRRHSLSAPC